MRYYQISSGNGPAECELAVAKFLGFLGANFNDIQIVQTADGYEYHTFKSVYLVTDADLSKYEGTIQWICKSPYRPNHRRKNWFISFREFREAELTGFDEKQIVFQTMRAGGHGGQNVNKVETAVRAIYTPTGYTTVCQDERSQFANKKRAIERIKIHLMEKIEASKASSRKGKWEQHNSLERGGAVARFRGEEFEVYG